MKKSHMTKNLIQMGHSNGQQPAQTKRNLEPTYPTKEKQDLVCVSVHC